MKKLARLWTEGTKRPRQVWSVLRLKPFDTSSIEGQSKERYRRIALTTAASMLARGVSLLAGLISVPLTVHYLGKERYGIWMTISSFFLIINCADLGIGSGLVNAVAAASGREDKAAIKRAVSSAFFLLLLIGLGIGGLFLAVHAFLPVHRLFSVSSPLSIDEANQATTVFAIMFALSLPLTVVQRLHEGLQEGFTNHLIQMAGGTLSLAFLLVVIALKMGLPWLVLGFLAGPFIANAANSVYQFRFRKPWARPDTSLFQKSTSRSLLRTGAVFFGLTMLTILGFQTDSLVIARVIGPDAVADYSAVQKLSQAAFMYWALLQSLWPAYGEAIARQDYRWVRVTIKRSLALSLVGGGCFGLALAVFGDQIVAWWVGRALNPPPGLAASFGAYVFFNSLVGTVAVVLNSTFLLKRQFFFLALASGVSFVLKIVLCARIGSPGTVWATIIGFTLFFILPGFFMIRKAFWKEVPSAACG